ncbi:phage portal protein [Nocardioides jensenii]|uniref:phage portal protein n=1 Tax=Nocardioides jensenii TaxID=1843 RepID=UPI000829E467|nr:phage portal protein [Nocardioides jensenii]
MRFESLGQLGDWLEQSPSVYVADPPMTLMESIDAKSVWASQPSVRKVVDYIARNVASIPINHYARISETERKRVTDDPIAAMLRKPSAAPRMTPYRFWHGVLVDRLIYDRWCCIISTDEGRPWLDRIPARRFQFHTDSLDRIDGVVVYAKDGTKRTLAPETCLFDAGYSTRGGNGTSPMETLKDILNEASEGVDFRRSVLARGARIPGYIHRPTAWPADGKARERFISGWRNFESGGGREGGTPMLEDGMEYKTLDAFKPVDLELMQGRTLTDIEVASAFHIAPELVGAREGTFANIDAFRQMLFGPNLGPYITEWEQVLDAAFGDEGHYLEANVDVKLRGSFLEQAAATSTAVGGPWMARNEARSMRNMPPVEGGDELITPLNVLVGGQASPHDSGSQNTTPKTYALHLRETDPAASEPTTDDADNGDGPNPTGL